MLTGEIRARPSKPFGKHQEWPEAGPILSGTKYKTLES